MKIQKLLHMIFTQAMLFAAVQFAISTEQAFAEEPAKITAEQATFFEKQIRPLLVEKCISCHGEKQQKGELRLDHPSYVLKGGETGPALVLGKPAESLLIEAVKYESLEMPPNNNKLKPEQIDLLVKWIEMGAPWPATDKEKIAIKEHKEKPEAFSAEERAWWAIQPIKKTPPPAITHPLGSKHPVDLFIMEKLAKQQLTPAPLADKRTLVRRLYLDLTGLPPTVEQTDAFLNNNSPQSYEQLVDELLASPGYGERWGRIWLDAVRYADGDGYRADHFRPNSWRYRDYVIKSLNEDKPYDRFVQEQLAGDELFPENTEAQMATGYLCNGIYEYNNRDAVGQWDNMLSDITNNTADVFLGLGLQCAQCHDHKYDPLLQQDFYRLRAFFAPVEIKTATVVASPAELDEYNKKEKIYLEATKTLREQIASLESPEREKLRVAALGRFPLDVQEYIFKDYKALNSLQRQHYQLCYRQVDYDLESLDKQFKGEQKDKLLALKRDLAKFDNLKPAPLPTAQTACDIAPEASPVYIPKKAKKNIEPGIPTILDAQPMKITKPENPELAGKTTGRRSTLAKWITSPDNPLPARVIVNRIWQAHFGKGLTPNANDFGFMGGAPTHPELLDHLASQFVQNGWSLKKLHKTIVTSHTYCMSTSHPNFAEYQLRDPLNLWMWRTDTRRLDAEQIRDSLLLICGKLDTQMGGEGVKSDQPRRGIYTRYMRNTRDPLMDVFDLPLFFSSSSSRDTTTTPIQSLLLINSPMMHRFSKELADKITKENSDPTVQVQKLWLNVLGRNPTDQEVKTALSFLETQKNTEQKNKKLELASKASLGKLPYRSGSAVIIDPDQPDNFYKVNHKDDLNLDNFTIETYFEIRSVYQTGQVRPLVTKQLNTKDKKQGWLFGVTGKGSRRKPQTLVLQMFGDKTDGTFGEGVAFSDQLVEINKPYYAAVSVNLGKSGKTGLATFYLKDLSNDDEPLSVAKIVINITGGTSNNEPLTIGGFTKTSGMFDGLIDEVRISQGVIPSEKLIINAEANLADTRGYWRFEPDQGILKDSSGNGHDILANKEFSTAGTIDDKVLTDLCHVLFNMNEFLYMD